MLKCNYCFYTFSLKSFFKTKEQMLSKMCDDVYTESREFLPAIHIDSMEQQILTKDCENLKLETVCNKIFKLCVEKIVL